MSGSWRLEDWLEVATRKLARESAVRVRSEIAAHYEGSRDAALLGGVTAITEDEADRAAVTALGDPRAANSAYRKVLLTAAEVRMLRTAQWEAQAVCSNLWFKWLFRALPVAALAGAAALFSKGDISTGWALFSWALAIGLLFAAQFLPVNTPRRGLAFRVTKWVLILTAMGMAFAPDVFKWSWLMFSCLWPMIWLEWTRVELRRKLPVSQWPRQLFL